MPDDFADARPSNRDPMRFLLIIAICFAVGALAILIAVLMFYRGNQPQASAHLKSQADSAEPALTTTGQKQAVLDSLNAGTPASSSASSTPASRGAAIDASTAAKIHTLDSLNGR